MAFATAVLSPQKKLADQVCVSVVAPTAVGQIEILEGHADLISVLSIGKLRLNLEDGTTKVFFVAGGLLEVQDQRVTLLADVGESVTDIDRDRAEQALERALERLKEPRDDIDPAKALLAKQRAQIRLELVDTLLTRS